MWANHPVSMDFASTACPVKELWSMTFVDTSFEQKNKSGTKVLMIINSHISNLYAQMDR